MMQGNTKAATAIALALLVAILTFQETSGQSADAKPFGISQRIPWTTSRITGSPEPPPPYRTVRAFPNITFAKPLDIAFAQGSNRIFIAEQFGKVFSFPNDDNAAKADLFADLPNQIRGLDKVPFCSGVSALYGIAFHPKYAENHYVYICYVLNYALPQGHAPLTPKNQDGSRISRFKVIGDPPHIDPGSEKIILTWFAGGHNGGCIKFGPDGDLYISTGDGGDPDPPDPYNTGQDISDLLCSILRIDVDHPDGDKPYSIPANNPFIHTPGARPEVYAYGLRNPWRMNFDSLTGNLWVGDVGWELWESVNCVKPGGNYGWSIMEGPNPVHPNGKLGPTPITPPQVALSHTEAASLTGGIVYRGTKLSELNGYYLFGDWQTSRLWAAKCDGDKLEPHRTIAQTTQRVVAFGEEPNHEILIVDHGGGGIWRIAPNHPDYDPAQFPRKLSQTGLFTDTPKQLPSPGVIPFSINAPQWVDGAVAKRWIAIPGDGTMAWGHGVWDDQKPAWPKNSVLVRTLSSDQWPGGATQPIETQIMHFDGKDWQAYTYAWNADHTDADLIDADGDTRMIQVPDMQDMTRDLPHHNGTKQQIWHFASRAQCLTCHSVWNDYALAFNVPQLDRIESFGAVSDNQVRTFRHLGMLLDPQPPGSDPAQSDQKLALTNPYDNSADLNERARSYLHVNCSVCHRFGGGGSALFDVRKELSPDKLHLIDAAPNLGGFGIDNPRLICPGDPTRSVVFYRMAKLGRGRMPHIGSDRVDGRGMKLLIDWIHSLDPKSPTSSPATERLDAPATSDADRAVIIDQQLQSPIGALALLADIYGSSKPSPALSLITAKGIACQNEVIHDLFRPFDPTEQTRIRLGPNINATKLLAIKGDAARGKQVFFGAGPASTALCARCHRIGGEGTDFGPDLSHIATKYNRADLLDNIIYPSKTIALGFETYVCRTKDGDIYSGFLVKKTDQEIVLKDAQLKEIHVTTSDIDKLKAQTISAMPEGLLGDLEPQQAADLLEFIASLK